MSTHAVELWDGWSLTLPTGCETSRNQDGSWSAWDETHVIDVSIVTVGGWQGGRAPSPEQMLDDLEGWEHHDLDGAIARVSRDTDTTDTPDGPQTVEWTRLQAAATNTVLVMSVGNTGSRDAPWHDVVWKSVRYQAPRKGLLGKWGR